MKLVNTREKKNINMHQATSLQCWKKAIGKQDDDPYYKERVPNVFTLEI